jgi:hypothetical protein
MVDCWWGLVESRGPQRYNWSGYHDLFNMVRDIGLKQQVLLFLLHFSSFVPIILRGGLHCV